MRGDRSPHWDTAQALAHLRDAVLVDDLQIYQSSLRDDFLSRKVVTKAYSARASLAGNASLEEMKQTPPG